MGRNRRTWGGGGGDHDFSAEIKFTISSHAHTIIWSYAHDICMKENSYYLVIEYLFNKEIRPWPSWWEAIPLMTKSAKLREQNPNIQIVERELHKDFNHSSAWLAHNWSFSIFFVNKFLCNFLQTDFVSRPAVNSTGTSLIVLLN